MDIKAQNGKVFVNDKPIKIQYDIENGYTVAELEIEHKEFDSIIGESFLSKEDKHFIKAKGRYYAFKRLINVDGDNEPMFDKTQRKELWKAYFSQFPYNK